MGIWTEVPTRVVLVWDTLTNERINWFNTIEEYRLFLRITGEGFDVELARSREMQCTYSGPSSTCLHCRDSGTTVSRAMSISPEIRWDQNRVLGFNGTSFFYLCERLMEGSKPFIRLEIRSFSNIYLDRSSRLLSNRRMYAVCWKIVI